jgi:ribonuclease HI
MFPPVIKSPTKNEHKIFPTTEYVLHFDGCSKGNPGPSGIGAVIYKNKEEIGAYSKYIGELKTNNEAEYSALILGLEKAILLDIASLSVCGDSLLVINQINSVYKVKNMRLFPLYEKVMSLKNKFTYIDFNHVYRTENKRADELSNLALTSIYPEDELIDLDEAVKIKLPICEVFK